LGERSDNVLSYGRADHRVRTFLAAHRRGVIIGTVVVALLFLIIVVGAGPTSGQIRLDTGDLRYCRWGIPLSYKRMPEPARSKIVVLAAKSPAVPATWVTCITYPRSPESNTDSMCRGCYWYISIWADEDPKIARWALEDLVDYIPRMLTRGGLPESAPVLSDFVWIPELEA